MISMTSMPLKGLDEVTQNDSSVIADAPSSGQSFLAIRAVAWRSTSHADQSLFLFHSSTLKTFSKKMLLKQCRKYLTRNGTSNR